MPALKKDPRIIDVMLDEALEGTFPASDPIAVTVNDAARQRPRQHDGERRNDAIEVGKYSEPSSHRSAPGTD